MIITLEHYFLWFLFYSFVGWMYESILVSCQQHRLVNRGFLNGPLCPIYGTGAILGVAILGNVHNPIIIFLISMVGATILEYTTSWVMEQLFHARWWDYTKFPLNFNGRVCLFVSLVWGGFALLFVYIIQPQFEKLVAALHRHPKWPARLVAIGGVLLAVDMVSSAHIAVDIGNKLDHFGASWRFW